MDMGIKRCSVSFWRKLTCAARERMNQQYLPLWAIFVWKLLDASVYWTSQQTDQSACQVAPRTCELDDEARTELAQEVAVRVVEAAAFAARRQSGSADAARAEPEGQGANRGRAGPRCRVLECKYCALW